MPYAFFGLELLPGKTYSQTVEESFRLSMAALAEKLKSNDSRSCVKVSVDETSHVLCSLKPDSKEQQTLDIVFEVGDEITFSVSGENTVHLTGNYLPEEDEDVDFDSDEDSEDDEDSQEDSELSDEEEITEADIQKLRELVGETPDEDDSEMDSDFEEQEDDDLVEEQELAEDSDVEEDADALMEDVEEVETGKKRKAAQKAAAVVAEKKLKDNSSAAIPAKSVAAKAAAPEPKKKEKKVEKKEETPKKQKVETPKAESPKKKVLANGLEIEDIKVGTGAVAKKGKKVGLRYIGRLKSNKKVFDKNVQGPPFDFNLGRGEVIKGWELGIENMKVNGERRLTIPAALAYGKRGAPPDIPKNAALEFEVKLLSVK